MRASLYRCIKCSYTEVQKGILAKRVPSCPKGHGKLVYNGKIRGKKY